ncbi:sulfotransferase 1E1-like [Bolinopsis microptera]|uniref:sulfotransferase 1E1-like n=1 Tax=Bolinopsis microptera TaxID=2820187 RepID=UPI00307AFC6A
MMEEKDRRLYGELQLPFNHSYLHGRIYPPFIKQKHLDATRIFQLRSDDVLIATYPKNGTTWTQKIIQNLHKVHKTGHDLTRGDKVLLEVMPWLENTPHEIVDKMPGPRYLKTHNSYNLVAYNPNIPCKYVYIARNPKDVCVSLYHHCKGFAAFEYDGPFEEFADLFLKGTVESSDWWEHVKEFYQNTRDMDVFFMKYEDMHADGVSAIKKLNDFCSLPPMTDEMATEVLQLSAFKSMKADPKSNYSWLDDVRKKDQAPFMRKGTVGDWSNYFTPELAAKFDNKTREVFADIDLDFCDKL